MKLKTNYDITIVGGGTAGCACAYIAGKLGLKTLLIENESYLGGTITSSLVIPAMKTSENAINTDFYDDLYDNLKKVNGVITYKDGNKGWFNPELLKIVLDKMILDSHVDILFESKIIKTDDCLSGYNVTICDNNIDEPNEKLLTHIVTRYIVDATGDAKICKMKNFKFLDDNNLTQPVNLRFIMSGVDTRKLSDWLLSIDNDTNVTTSCSYNGIKYLSTAYTWDTDKNWALKPYFKKALDDKVLVEEDTNYFQIFSVGGTTDSIAFNAPRILDNTLSRSEVYIQGRQSILRLSNFCKRYIPGFKNAYISSIANKIGTRVSNRVMCKYVYTKDDLISGKKFEHPAVISNYPIDIHSYDKNKSTLKHVEVEYQLPIEALIVKDDFYVIGRCLSADFESQAALRIIPSCFSMGEAVAKDVASKIKHQNC